MAGTEQTWKDVGDQFATIGRRLQANYREKRSERGGQDDADALREAFLTLARTAERTLVSAGAAVRDRQLAEDARRAATSLGAALSATFEGVGEGIRRRSAGQKDGQKEDGETVAEDAAPGGEQPASGEQSAPGEQSAADVKPAAEDVRDAADGTGDTGAGRPPSA